MNTAAISDKLRRLFEITCLSIVIVSSPAHAANATYTYDVLGRLTQVSYAGKHTVVYGYDANGNRTEKIIAGGGGGTNRPPVAEDDFEHIEVPPPRDPYTVRFSPLWNDSDPDGDPLTITSVTRISGGNPVIDSSGTMVTIYSFDVNNHFTYTISDGRGGTDTAQVILSRGY